jgi:gliding motility-associated protein GldL
MGAVVIVGALFKIIHFELGPLTDKNACCRILTEAFIFALSAFEPVDNELDWSLYPELATGVKVQRDQKGAVVRSQGMLSQKLDAMLKDAKIDGELMSSLGNSIKILSQQKSIVQQLNLWLQQKNTVKS